MKIDSQRLHNGMTIRVYNSEQALELLSALEEEYWHWFSGTRIFHYQHRLLKDIRGIYIKDLERRLITYYPSDAVNMMLCVGKDIVDFRELIIEDGSDDYFDGDIPAVDLSNFLE